MEQQIGSTENVAFEQGEIERAKKTFETRGFGGNETLVEGIKSDAAILLARFNRIPTPGAEAGRLAALAKTHLEEAVMWAVKAITRAEPIST